MVTSLPAEIVCPQKQEEESRFFHQCLHLLAKGLSNADIAAPLYLSEGTVRNYVSALLAKLAVQDRTQAALLGLYCGWP